MKQDINKIDSRLSDVEFVCEATSCERQNLWEKFHYGLGGGKCTCGADKYPHLPWEQDSMGRLIQVGTCFGHPVVISVVFAKINGLNVMFWENTSRVVDREMIQKWLDDNVSPSWDGGRIAHTNAMNFHHVIDASKEKERKCITNEHHKVVEGILTDARHCLCAEVGEIERVATEHLRKLYKGKRVKCECYDAFIGGEEYYFDTEILDIWVGKKYTEDDFYVLVKAMHKSIFAKQGDAPKPQTFYLRRIESVEGES